jgi:hypothetical protein
MDTMITAAAAAVAEAVVAHIFEMEEAEKLLSNIT